MVLRVERQILHEQRSRADDAHLAPQHIDQLGQLVERRRSQMPPERGEALSVRKKLARVVSLVRHRAELDPLEFAIVQSDTRLTKKHRCPQPQPNQKCDDQQEGNPDRAGEQNQHEVEGAFSAVRGHR